MVKICSNTHYPAENETTYKSHFEKYPYALHTFQKHSIEAIVDGHHILVTAPTGSGKTLPGEFAIEYFVNQGKKVIYTTPIKALSNQKFYDFSHKYPHISFGVLTGDLKTNPDAQCLIMTTEILLNKLYQVSQPTEKEIPINPSSNSFEMDIQQELACVVFDEVHYINDAHRGHVWEQSIMMLPPQVQMVMLSATIDKPERFAEWVEGRQKGVEGRQKGVNFAPLFPKVERVEVYIASNTKRAVPLTHYSFITTNSALFKVVKDKSVQEEIKAITNKPIVMQSADGLFNEPNYFKIQKALQLLETKQVYVKRNHVLNNLCKYLAEEQMLPALCFVFSRKQLELCAKEVTAILLEDDSKVPYTIRNECEKIIRKFPNFQEYLELKEYNELVALLEKGIGIHHAGVLAPLREMVELLYAKGYIKLLFCTETLSIGINMPVKTAIFTDIHKFDGTQNRTLYAHEYTQAAGRAGRLGLDKVGHVIHLNNLFRPATATEYRAMMNGKPQTLVSKFKISYNLLLNLIDIGNQDFARFARRSMIQQTVEKEVAVLQQSLSNLDARLQQQENVLQTAITPRSIMNEYLELTQQKFLCVNKKRREIEKRLQELKDLYPNNIEKECLHMEKYNETIQEKSALENDLRQTTSHLDNNVQTVIAMLEEGGYIIQTQETNEKTMTLTNKGQTACCTRETHCLVFAECIEEGLFHLKTGRQLAAIFSCFTNITVPESKQSLVPYSTVEDNATRDAILKLRDRYDYWQQEETSKGIQTGQEYEIHYDLIRYISLWCDCTCAEECRLLLLQMEEEKEIFLGEFVKALLKINNIALELEKVAEQRGDMAFLQELKQIPALTLKYVATNQSLYV